MKVALLFSNNNLGQIYKKIMGFKLGWGLELF